MIAGFYFSCVGLLSCTSCFLPTQCGWWSCSCLCYLPSAVECEKSDIVLDACTKIRFRSRKAVVCFFCQLCIVDVMETEIVPLCTQTCRVVWLQACTVKPRYNLCVFGLSADTVAIQKPHLSVVVCYRHWGACAYVTIWHKCTNKYSLVGPESPESKRGARVARAGTLEAAEFPSTCFKAISRGNFCTWQLDSGERHIYREKRWEATKVTTSAHWNQEPPPPHTHTQLMQRVWVWFTQGSRMFPQEVFC